MLWVINGEEYIFNDWQELGMTLRDLSRTCASVTVEVGPICDDCNGQGTIIAFATNGVNVHMECAECNASGIKH